MRRMKLLLLLAVLPLFPQSQDWRAVMRKSLERMQAHEKKLPDYGFVRKTERKEMNSDGSVKKQERFTVRREFFEGGWANFMLERNGTPITAEQRREGEAALRKRRTEDKPKQAPPAGRSTEDAWIEEFPDALDYTLAGEESVNGRKAWILNCNPRPGYKPKNMRAKVFEKMRGKVWIDQTEGDMVRVEAEMFDSVSVGLGLLGKIDKGTRFELRKVRLNDGVWVPEKTHVRFAVRIMLVKYMYNEIINETSDYRPKPS